MSTHFVKVRGARDSPKGRTLRSHTLEGESQEWPVMGGYLNVKVSIFQIPGNFFCEKICFNVIILNGREPGTVRPRLLQALKRFGSGESTGSSAELDTLIRCRGWSTRRALSLVDQ